MTRQFICEDCGCITEHQTRGGYRKRCIPCQNKRDYQLKIDRQKKRRGREEKEKKAKYIKLPNGLEVRNDILGQTMVRDD